MTAYDTIDSPIGELLLTAEGGALTRLYMSPFDVEGAWEHDPAALAEPARQLREYFAGERTEFELALDAAGTDFQRRVWERLVAIPYGETTTYGTLAKTIGRHFRELDHGTPELADQTKRISSRKRSPRSTHPPLSNES